MNCRGMPVTASIFLHGISVTPLKLDLTAHEHFKTVGARLKLPRSRRGGKPAHIG